MAEITEFIAAGLIVVGVATFVYVFWKRRKRLAEAARMAVELAHKSEDDLQKIEQGIKNQDAGEIQDGLEGIKDHFGEEVK